MPNSIPNGQLIKLLHVRFEKRVNNGLRSDDLTMMQIAVLMELRAAEHQSLTLKELERRFSLAQSTVAGVLSRLEQKGFVEAYGDPEDKRIKVEHITAAGLKCCANATCRMDETEEQLVKGFTLEEQKIFNALLERAAENMR